MRQRTTKHFTLASLSAIAICVAVYTVAGIFGYLTFGSNVEDDILSNYSATEPLVMVALIAMAAKTFTSYPILLFCGRFESLYPCLLLLRILLKQDTALLSHVSQCVSVLVTGVTSQVFSII